MLRIALIACSKSKLTHAAPARDLYTGRVFQAARAYAEVTCDGWMILSAKHGLIEPDKVIEPYDDTLAAMTPAERRAWVELVRDQFDTHGVRFVAWPTTLVLLAGELYRSPFPLGYGVDFQHVEYAVPLERLSIGEQFAWLKARLKANTPTSALGVSETPKGRAESRSEISPKSQRRERRLNTDVTAGETAVAASPSKLNRSQTGSLSAVVHDSRSRVSGQARDCAAAGSRSAVHQPSKAHRASGGMFAGGRFDDQVSSRRSNTSGGRRDEKAPGRG